MRIFVRDIFIIYDKLYSRCCACTRYCARHPGTNATLRRHPCEIIEWQGRESEEYRTKRVSLFSRREALPYGRIYRVLLIRLDKPQERIAYGNREEKRGSYQLIYVEMLALSKYTMTCFIQSTLSTNRKWGYFTNTSLNSP